MRTVMVTLLIFMAFALVACGGNDGAGSGSGDQTDGGQAVATPIPTATPTPLPTLPPTRQIEGLNHQGHIYNDGVTTIHTVQAGETLGQIANQYAIPIDLIANANYIYDRDTLEEGEILFIPPCD